MQSYNFNELSPWHDLLEIRVGKVVQFQNTTVAAISIWLTILKISQKRKETKRKNSNYVTFAQFSCNHA